MFKVEKDVVGRYHISIGLGKIYLTKDIEEVATALNHYYGEDSCRLGDNPNCPLCRGINEEMKAKAKGETWQSKGKGGDMAKQKVQGESVSIRQELRGIR